MIPFTQTLRFLIGFGFLQFRKFGLYVRVIFRFFRCDYYHMMFPEFEVDWSSRILKFARFSLTFCLFVQRTDEDEWKIIYVAWAG